MKKYFILIDEELDLVTTYIFLQKKRYGNYFKVATNSNNEIKSGCLIPPLALQILIENCLKHNAVSRKSKLIVVIYVEDNRYLVIQNNNNPLFNQEPSTDAGLQNMKIRYQLILNSEIIQLVNVAHFTVKLPSFRN